MFLASVLLLTWVVALKVYKKTAPNGKLTVYLGKRDFVDDLDRVEPIDGVVVVDQSYLQGRKILGQVSTTFRYGREEDEVMGVKFSKELCLAQEQLVPRSADAPSLTYLQERLIRKLGENAFPFRFQLPPNAPCSVSLQPGGEYSGRPLGVQYELKAYVGDDFERKPHKRNSVGMAIRKVQYAPVRSAARSPETCVSKGFSLSPGRVELRVTLDKDLFYHGEIMAVGVSVANHAKKSVRSMAASVVQTCELTMIDAQYTRTVAGLETKEGCPIGPGAKLSTVFYLTPLAANNKDKRGIALDGRLRDEDVHLASSTAFPEGRDPNDAVGIVVSYAVRVRLHLGALGGDVTADLPFKLMHPVPDVHSKGADPNDKIAAYKRAQFRAEPPPPSVDLVFEDFAKWRQSVDEGDQ